MEAAISIAILLFILSMINERIANFIKLQFSDKTVLKIKIGNLRTKSANAELEDERSKRILSVNIICGTLVAIAMRADLINLLGHLDKPYTAIGWENPLPEGFGGWLLFFIGCFLTGCFLSLGSKFWHDLLDLLLYTKNLKGKLVDERTYQQINSIDHLEEFIQTPEYRLSQIAVDTHQAQIKSIQGVLSIGNGYLNNRGNKIGCVEIHVTQASVANQIQATLPIRLKNSGSTVNIPTKVIVTGNYPVTQSAEAGKGVQNSSGILGRGTIGAVVKDTTDSSRYILSCFHVLNGDTNWSRLSDSIEIVDESGHAIADLYFGFRTTDMDAAIAKLKPGIGYSNALINSPSVIRDVKYEDVLKETPVSILGAKTGTKVQGFVYNDSYPATFRYPDSKLWDLNDLIVITRVNEHSNNYQPITQGGDSGALVVDDKNAAIGLVVGADETFSYAIKLNKIAKSMDISL